MKNRIEFLLKLIKLNRQKSLILLGLALLLLIFLFINFIFFGDFMLAMENLTYDLRSQFKQRNFSQEPDKDIVVFAYNDQTINFSHQNNIKIPRWPISRDYWILVNNYLIRGNANVICYDIFFSMPSENTENDNKFADSLKKLNIFYFVVSTNFLFTSQNELTDVFTIGLKNIKDNNSIMKFIDFSIAVVNKEKVNSNKQLKSFYTAIKCNGSPNRNLFSNTAINYTNVPIDSLLKHAKGLGFVSIIAASQNDSTIRAIPLLSRAYENFFLPNISLSITLEQLFQGPVSIDENYLHIGNKKIPYDKYFMSYIDWRSTLLKGFEVPAYNTYSLHKAFIYEMYFAFDRETGFRILPEEQNYFMQPPLKHFYLLTKDIINSNIHYLRNNYYNKLVNKKITNEQFHYLLPPSGSDFYLNEGFSSKLLADDYIGLNISEKNSPILNNVNAKNEIIEIYLSILTDGNLDPVLFNLERYKNEYIQPSAFTNNIIMIGNSTSGGDLYATPVSHVTPGPIILANAVDNLLNDTTFIRKSPLWLNFLIYTVLLLLAFFLVRKCSHTITMIMAFILSLFILLGLNMIAFVHLKLWIPIAYPVLFYSFFFVYFLISNTLLARSDLAKTYKLATTDGLTGLYNHRYFQEKINKKLEDVLRKEDFFSLLFIDIDFFKKFNDVYGHRSGDLVLIQVARILQQSIRKNDILCRYGGEELCIILDKTNLDEALDIANKLVMNIARSEFCIEASDKKARVTISIGVSNYPAHGKTVPELIEFADQCLYRAKEGGRNRVGDLCDNLSECPECLVCKEVEISREKIIREFDKIKQACLEKQLNSEEIIEKLIQDYINSRIRDNSDKAPSQKEDS